MKDARALERKFPICYLRVFDRRTRKLVGRVVDITTRGMRLVGSMPLTTGRTHQLSLALPQAVHPGRQLRFEADVRWTGPDLNPDFCDTGLEVCSIAKEDRETIGQLMRSYVFHA